LKGCVRNYFDFTCQPLTNTGSRVTLTFSTFHAVLLVKN
jgi:hypothetical protein